MMKYLLPVLILALLFCVQYCKSTQATPAEYTGKQIIFGNGGGVAGIYTQYYLYENGTLFKKSTTSETYESLKKVKKNQAKQLFDNYEVLQLGALDFNHPGNMTYFIKMKTSDQTHEINWGDASHPTDDKVKLYYQLLMNLTK